jgi:hypothetical protein
LEVDKVTDPIIPPPELVKQWFGDYYGCPVSGEISGVEAAIAARAAQWGADQELKACCEWLVSEGWFKYEHEAVEDLRAARRPKPPSLKEQALDVLHLSFDRGYLKEEAADTIRRALEALPE